MTVGCMIQLPCFVAWGVAIWMVLVALGIAALSCLGIYYSLRQHEDD